MTENFTTCSKGSETSKDSEKYSLELNVNSNEFSFGNERIFVWLFRTNIRIFGIFVLALWKITLVNILVKTTGKWYIKNLLSIYIYKTKICIYICMSSHLLWDYWTEFNQILHALSYHGTLNKKYLRIEAFLQKIC